MDYKKILEGVVNIINTTEKSDIGFINICTYIGENCPELVEGEDEKIRKAILKHIQFCTESIPDRDKFIAWLEKQGEQKPVTDFSDLRIWKYIVDAVLTEKEGIGQYLDSPFTKEVAKKLQKRFGDIDQKSNELPNGDDYGIDSLWHAQRILEKTLGKVEGYQSDDGILEHECAISAVKKLYEQKPAWSEEDEEMVGRIIEASFDYYDKKKEEKIYAWLKSLKDRVQPKHREWTDEDTTMAHTIISDGVRGVGLDRKQVEWLKSLNEILRPNHWKPSDEQMKALYDAVIEANWETMNIDVLESLYNDLKKM